MRRQAKFKPVSFSDWWQDAGERELRQLDHATIARFIARHE
jgi:hypothetical protein